VTTDLVRVPTEAGISPLQQQLEMMKPLAEYCNALSKSKLVPDAYRGKPEEMMAAALMGDGLGLDAFTSWQEIYVDRGRVGLTAKLMRGLAHRNGAETWIVEANPERVTVAGRRKGQKEVSTVSWTMDMARNARLDKKDNWRNHPMAMLLARATSQLVRIIAPEALIGFTYSIEEIRDGFTEEDAIEVDEAPEGVTVPPAKKTTTRKPPKKAAKKAAAKPPPPAEPVDPVDELDELDQIAEGGDPDEDVVDAIVVEDDEVAREPDDDGRAYPPGQALAIRASEVGLDEATRHGMNLAITGGASQSSNDLSREQIDVAFALLKGVEEGTVEVVTDGDGWVVMENGEPVYSSAGDGEPPAGDDAPPDTAEGWQEIADAQGLKRTDVVRAAAAAASGLGEEPPANLTGLAAASLKLRTAVLVALRSSDS
jgi:hypothetical protein